MSSGRLRKIGQSGIEGENHCLVGSKMCKRKFSILYLILAVLSVLSGIYLEGMKAPSYFAYADSDTTSSCLETMDTNNFNEQLCTPEMLGVYNHNCMNIRHTTGRFINSGRVIRLLPAFFFITFLLAGAGKAFLGAEEIILYPPCRVILIMNYIHRLDGKKRS